MANTTTCPTCGHAYVAHSEEEANSPSRQCLACHVEAAAQIERERADLRALVAELRDEVEEIDGDDDTPAARSTRIEHAEAEEELERFDRGVMPIPAEVEDVMRQARERADAFMKSMQMPAHVLYGTSLATLTRAARALRTAEAAPMPQPPSRTPILDSLPPEQREEMLRQGAMCGDSPIAVEHMLRQLKTHVETPLAGQKLKEVLDLLNQIPEGTMTHHYDQTKQTIADAENAANTGSPDRGTAEMMALRAVIAQLALNVAAIADALERNERREGERNGG